MTSGISATELILRQEARDRARPDRRRADADADADAIARDAAPAIRSLIARELAPLRKQLAELTRAHNGIAGFLNGEGEDDFAGMLGSRTGKLHARCNALEARIGGLMGECEKKMQDEFKSRAPMIYRGVWNNTADYLVGDLVTHGGGGWVCRADHRDQRPGSGGAWQLAIKAA